MKLRYYQSESINAAWDWIRNNDGSPCIVLPTGAGKSLVMATLARQVVEWGSRCLILAHVKELVDQNAKELCQLAPEINVGVYSAGLKQRNTTADVISCGIQSVYQKADAFNPPPDVLLIDEAHLIPPDGDGMYLQFIRDMQERNPQCTVIGLTATPYRTGTGMIVGDDTILTEVCYEAAVNELIAAGYLSPLISKTPHHLNTSNLRTVRGDFDSKQAEDLMLLFVDEAVTDMLARAEERKSILIFAQSVQHAWAIEERLEAAGEVCQVVTGGTATALRDKYIEQFKQQELRILVNCMVLTTGFNARGVDCVALMRPTKSPGLYYQMVGRGLRLSPETGKTDCLILDYGNNIKRHGPIDKVDAGGGRPSEGDALTKTCPECKSEIWLAAQVCPDCGFEFPIDPVPSSHEVEAANDAILSQDIEPDVYQVSSVEYVVHKKRGAEASAPKTMRVNYICGFGKAFSEWICIEHTGFARNKAERWWGQRVTAECPVDAELAVLAAEQHMPAPQAISVIKDGKYQRVVEWDFGELELPIETQVDAESLVRPPAYEDEPDFITNEFDPDFEPPF